MATLVFVIALILAMGGGGGLIASVDLMPTEVGLLYAACGVIALSAAAVVAAIGALILKVDRIGARLHHALTIEEDTQIVDAQPVRPQAPVVETRPVAQETEDVVNANRAGHLPTFTEIENAIAHPEAPPRLIGRYSAGGANYAIFSDGSVEAEMADGMYNFASMQAFRAFVEGRRPEAS